MRCRRWRSPTRTWPGSARWTTASTRSCTSRRTGRAGPPGRWTSGGRPGEPLGPLAGVPLALKDVFTTTDMPTTCGSAILNGWRPPYDATITRRLRQAGVVILGKTNMDEFAMGSSTENSAFGPSHNPWDLARVPGGSSGGSSAAVAAFEAPLGDRHRHRRVDPPAGGGLRGGRGEADLRRLLPVRGGGLRVLAGHAGPAGAHRARRGAAARGDVRSRPVRFHLGGRAGAAGGGRRPAGGRERADHRRGARARRRGLPERGAGPVRRGGGAAGVAGREGDRRSPARTSPTRCPPTT